MAAQLKVGARGVERVKKLLSQYGVVDDLQDDRGWQKRGVDLYAPGLGYVEVKTDRHTPDRVFLEVDVEGSKPGGVFSSRADWLAVYFVKTKQLFLFRLPDLQFWLAQHYALLRATTYRVITSRRGRSVWSVGGVLVPLKVLRENVTSEEVGEE